VTKTGIAKLFRRGGSQAVRLPQEFQFQGDWVRLRRVPQGVLLEQAITDPAKWFEELDRLAGERLLESDRKQPPTPRRNIFG